MQYLMEEKYNLIKNHIINSKEKNPINILKEVMSLDFINMHGPEHHFLDGACFLVAYKNSGGNVDVDKALNLLSERTIKMPGAICGYWGVCGSVTSIGAALSIINSTGPLSTNNYYKDNMEYTSLVINKMSEIGGPRCCKRNAFIALSYAVDFVDKKYNIKMYKDQIKCEFSLFNKQCILNKCMFYLKK